MTAPVTAEQAAAVVAAYQASTTALRDRLAAFIRALWLSLPAYRDAQAAEFAGQVVPVVNGAMAQMQAATAAYLATLAGLSGGSAVPIAARSLSIGTVRNGADPREVYGRPFHLVWRQLGNGETLDKAVQSGLSRATQTALTDVQLAKTYTSQQVVEKDRRAVGYRRVLEGPHSCGLCIVASTQRYHKAALMPIHPGCDCSVAPIFGNEDPGHLLNQNVLGDVHAAVAERFGADSSAARRIPGAFASDGSPLLYKDVLITHRHGEIGPVLGIRGASFTGSADIASTPK